MPVPSDRRSSQLFAPPTRPPQRAAFTLPEILVVIGILVLLVAMLVPVLVGARKHADRVRCLSNMRQIGQATVLYGNDNNNYWPPQSHSWGPVAARRQKRWHDFLSRYALHGVVVDVNGVRTKADLNFTGTFDALAEPQIFSDEIRNGNNVLWGCPTWRRVQMVGSTAIVDDPVSTGYGWSRFFKAPDDIDPVTKNVRTSDQTIVSGDSKLSGTYPKANKYTRSGERALMLDNVSAFITVASNPGVKWKFKPRGVTPFPARPDVTTCSIDFDRHGKRPISNGPDDLSLNVLYADGHAAPASARDAWYAMRFE